MVLVLKNHEMEKLLPYRELLARLGEAIETAYREYGNQVAVNRPRSRMYIPTREPNTYYWFNNIAGIVPAFRAMALRIDSSLAREVTRDGKWAVENEGVAPDVDVENWPKDVIAGHDPQLERAVDEAMKLLKQNPPNRLTKEPPSPTWGKRKGGGS